ncbi:MAG TPA: response regulator [Candidatus Binatia bacterium]
MERPPRAPAKSLGPRAAPRGVGRRALIVDGDVDSAERVALWFRQEGWTAHVADDGVKALSLLSEKRIDLVVTDLQMPGMNGWELLRHLAGRWVPTLPASRRPARVVVVSGRSEAEVKRFAQRLGADAFLSKPIDRNTLVKTVARLFVTTNAACRSDADDRSP